jgi:hypothetical protein
LLAWAVVERVAAMATAVMVAVEMVVDAAEAMAVAERVLARRAAKAEGLAAEMATAC